MIWRDIVLKTLKRLSWFVRDRSGISLIYVTMALPALIGFGVLAIDVGRLLTLKSTLEHAADALALAGAGELDRRPDSITRAENAVATLVSNPATFASSVTTIDGSNVTRRYLSSLPADSQPIVAGNVTADPVQARFVEVTVTPVSFNTIFPVTFLGGVSNTAQASAVAVAGFDAVVCNFTPMFMCNPFEPAGNTDILRTTEILNHVSTEAGRRRLIEMKRIGPSGQWSSGNYGYLESPIGPGANALGEVIASIVPRACFIQNGVFTKPGNTAVSKDAFNVRFDMYKGSYSKTNPNYRPSNNVRKGFVDAATGPSGACNTAPLDPLDPLQATGFGRDSCFATGTCEFNNRIGYGDWDFDTYWQTNHGAAGTAKPNGYSNSKLPPRYTIYRHEIDNDLLGNQSPGDPGPPIRAGETGNPQCSTTTATDTPDRRILHAAILNCTAQPVDSGNSGGPYIVAAFAEFFISEPMSGPQDSLWVEMINVVEPGTGGGIARDQVQLYR